MSDNSRQQEKQTMMQWDGAGNITIPSGADITIDHASSPLASISQSVTIGPVSSDIKMGAHYLVPINGGSGYRCNVCHEEREVPELMVRTGGFPVVMYKLYLMGMFKEEPCIPDNDDNHRMPAGTHKDYQYIPNRGDTYWVSNKGQPSNTSTGGTYSVSGSISQEGRECLRKASKDLSTTR